MLIRAGSLVALAAAGLAAALLLPALPQPADYHRFADTKELLAIALLFRSRYTRRGDISLVFSAYALAKLLETFDRQLLALVHLVSGHTLKHLAAAIAAYIVLRSLQRRRVRGGSAEGSPGRLVGRTGDR